VIEKPADRDELAALNAEEKQIEGMILQQDARIMVVLRKGEEIAAASEKEAPRLRGVLADIKRRKRHLLRSAVGGAPAAHLRSTI